MQRLQDLLSRVIFLVTVLPIIRNLLASLRRWALIRQIERDRGTKVVTLIHRQPGGILGALSQRYLNLDDSEQVMKAIRQAGNRPIDLILHTPGGLVIAADQVSRALQAHPYKVTVIVPQYAMSGGTFVALAADEILMDRHAMLGPIDPQLNGLPAAGFKRLLALKSRDAIADEMIIYADLAEKAAKQLFDAAFGLLRTRMDALQAEEVARTLSEGRWTHDHPLYIEELRELGLPVSDKVPDAFRELLSLSGAAQSSILMAPDRKQPQRDH
jgi:ClpP class serine protease